MTDQFQLDIKLNTTKRVSDAQPLLPQRNLNQSNQYQGPAAIQHISGNNGITRDMSFPHEEDAKNMSMPGLA